MGGINHQPCRGYLPESTRLSRCVSLARIHFEQANVALEDVLLLELDGKKGSVSPIRHELQLSQDFLSAAIVQLNALHDKMRKLSYVDLPELHSIDLSAIGEFLISKGMVDSESWQKMSTMMQTGTFYANVKEFRVLISQLLKMTTDMHSSISRLADYADDGVMHRVLEENEPENLKPVFARLYTAWNRFHSVFLASSLVSTEVWYAHNNLGSLSMTPQKGVGV